MFGDQVEHDGKALAADEFDDHHHRSPSVASVHTRAIVTWLAIFPMAAVGMSVLGLLVPTWPAVVKALVLTLFVVPTAVYFAVPRLLILHGRFRNRPGAVR
jgi:antibiotic biosynthesis monooxygenase (ABM) superfamily enzyme